MGGKALGELFSGPVLGLELKFISGVKALGAAAEEEIYSIPWCNLRILRSQAPQQVI